MIAAFTWTLWIATSKQGRITEMALRADRPFLLVKDVQLTSDRAKIHKPEEEFSEGKFLSISSVQVIFCNYGKGPAVVQKVVATFELATFDKSSPNVISFNHGFHNLRACSQIEIERDLIANNEVLEITVPALDLLWEEYEAVTNRRKEMVVYGNVSYSDVFNNPYMTDFCQRIWFEEFGWFDDIEIALKAESRLGPSDHNKRT